MYNIGHQDKFIQIIFSILLFHFFHFSNSNQTHRRKTKISSISQLFYFLPIFCHPTFQSPNQLDLGKPYWKLFWFGQETKYLGTGVPFQGYHSLYIYVCVIKCNKIIYQWRLMASPADSHETLSMELLRTWEPSCSSGAC